MVKNVFNQVKIFKATLIFRLVHGNGIPMGIPRDRHKFLWVGWEWDR